MLGPKVSVRRGAAHTISVQSASDSLLTASASSVSFVTSVFHAGSVPAWAG